MSLLILLNPYTWLGRPPRWGDAWDEIDLLLEWTALLTINGGAALCLTPLVTLTFLAASSAGEVALMSFSGDGEAWSEWEEYLPPRRSGYALSSGYGEHSVYARFQDEEGNISPTVSDSIVLAEIIPSYGMMEEHGLKMRKGGDNLMYIDHGMKVRKRAGN